MAGTLWKFVVLLLTAAIGIQAQPTSKNEELLVRESNTYIPNGDFSAPLKGTWTIRTEYNLPRSYVSRTKSDGNYVVQVDPLQNCSNSDPVSGSRLELGGSVVNVVAQQELTITFQYRLAKSTNFYGLGLAVDDAVETVRPTFTKKVKANQWYTFTGSYKVDHRFTANSLDIRIVFVTCDPSSYPDYPTFQVDNVVVTT